LYLTAVRVTPSDSQGSTLSEFVAQAAAVLGTAPGSKSALDDRLAAAGYLGAHAAMYVKRFVTGPVWTYAVTPGFPRIRSIDIPQGVLNVRFSLRLSALAAFRTDAVAIIGARVPETEAVE